MAWYRRLFNLSRRQRVSRNIDRELEFHLAERIDELVASGESSEEATRIARRQFGNYSLQKERTRDVDILAWLESVLADVRYAVRGLLRTPAFTIVAILTLALGIGANTVLFSAADGILLDELEVQRPDELVTLRWIGGYNLAATGTGSYGYWADAVPGYGDGSFSQFAFERFREASRSLSEVFAFAPDDLEVRIDGQIGQAAAQLVSGNYYGAIGVSALRGRTLVPQDDTPNATPAAVVSEAYWRDRFGEDPAIIGRTVLISGVPFSVVGVISESVGNLERPRRPTPQISIPLAMEERIQPDPTARRTSPTSWRFVVMGRLANGASISQVEAELAPVFDELIPDGPPPAGTPPERQIPPRFSVIPGSHGVYDPEPEATIALAALTAVFGLVWVIVCVNLANLSLFRAETRQREIAVRLAIGAGRARLIRQLLTESLVLAVCGGAVGFAAAAACSYLLLSEAPAGLLRFDFRALLFAAGASAVTSLVFGFAPAVRTARIDPTFGIRLMSVRHTTGRCRLGKSLVGAQVALSLVLLVGAGLLLRTVMNLQSASTGFRPDNLVLFSLDNQFVRQYSAEQGANLRERLLERVAALPGVESVAPASQRLVSNIRNMTRMTLPEWEPDRLRESVNTIIAGPGFFETLEIPLRLGRTFTRNDYETAMPVAIVNQAFVEKYFSGSDPIGRRVQNVSFSPDSFPIVGVVADTKYATLRDNAEPILFVSQKREFRGLPVNVFHVRTTGNVGAVIPAIRQAAKEVDPALPPLAVSTQSDEIARGYESEWIFATLSIVFGALALLISMIGLFGLMSYVVAQRTKEIGIRIALGAQISEVRRSVLRESLTFVVIGTVIGVAVSLVVTRALNAFLFELDPGDPLTLLVSVTVMIAAAAVASYLPARRASGVDPLVALRHE